MIDLNSPGVRDLFERKIHVGTRAKAVRLYNEGRVLLRTASGNDQQCNIEAKVTGSSPIPYEVQIRLSAQGKTGFVAATCTCPMLENCKHIYATFLAAQEFMLSKTVSGAAPAAAASKVIPLKTPAPPPPPPRPSPAPELTPEWKQWLDRVTKPPQAQPSQETPAPVSPDFGRRIFYLLKPAEEGVGLELFEGQYGANGGVKSKYSVLLPNLLTGNSRGPQAADRLLLRKIFLEQTGATTFEPKLSGEAGLGLLTEIIATGRAYWRAIKKQNRPLSLGPPRAAKPGWQTSAKGWQKPSFFMDRPASVLPFVPPWYIDDADGSCGPLETGLPPEVAARWLSAPELPPDQSTLLLRKMRAGGDSALPQPLPIEIETIPATPPVPCLRLESIDRPERYSYFDEDEPERCHLAWLEFDYSGTRILSSERNPVIEEFQNGRLRRLTRDLKFEDSVQQILDQAGFCCAADIYFVRSRNLESALTFDCDTDWLNFVTEDVPRLKQKGWRIEITPDFAFRLVEAEEWYADAQPGADNEWFNTEIGVQVEGQKINLLPLLLEHFQRAPDLFGSAALSQLSDTGHLLVPLPDGRRLPFPIKRLKMMLGVLVDLFEPKALDNSGRLKLTKLRAAELSGAAGAAAFRWLGGENLRHLHDKLRDFRSIRAVPAPQGLQASLRGYQQEGLNWLQFLREFNLAGILADDMGLGKTVQALAHLLEEKNSGRADRPSLVIAPTSLMNNWRQECERFAPAIKLLVLHGQDRKQHFDKLAENDLVVTSYPLLPRDEEVLVNEKFHLVILDEAQYIKNPKTKYAQIVCQLTARHHLCLTGTPMENHLGELWSQFNFLLPGFLGDETRFRRLFRTPIEKHSDNDRREVLARRVGPFVLRRRKEQVASELPPKTEIRQTVELSGAQRDLYETIRLAMHQRVQEEVRNKGMSRAHIIILDALLKLRQVCCDPRLVKLDAARNVAESAKLELLMDLVPEMLAEGRKILLFSQFTSMLALVEAELNKASIPFVLLTGDTTDRATPVNDFQSGKAPLFLISLKAGGTGLNLTAADTVIHYDPWWNPAVEMQATDRAHRIGQTKSVFVYKLITVGTVEERILAMQERKQGLVEALLDENRKEKPQLTQDDLQVLFAPLS